jgi:hypothetical protein
MVAIRTAGIVVDTAHRGVAVDALTVAVDGAAAAVVVLASSTTNRDVGRHE